MKAVTHWHWFWFKTTKEPMKAVAIAGQRGREAVDLLIVIMIITYCKLLIQYMHEYLISLVYTSM